MLIMSVKKRLKEYLNYQEMTISDFERTISASNGYVNSISKSIGINKLEKIVENFPNLDLEWLLTGSGEMIKYQNNQYSQDINDSHITESQVPSGDKNYVPFYPVDFVGGNLESINDQTTAPEYYMYMPQFKGCVSFFSYNDSMEPLIQSGMMLFAKQVMDWQSHLEYGQIYGIVANDGRKYLKYIRRHPDREDERFIFKSENQDSYDDFEFCKKDVRSIWLIHGWIHQRVS
jgi:phage repressor protein C with HTH and peptisase S24 domain